jgi:tetratricopeptide (TPR) repeat protein
VCGAAAVPGSLDGTLVPPPSSGATEPLAGGVAATLLPPARPAPPADGTPSTAPPASARPSAGATDIIDPQQQTWAPKPGGTAPPPRTSRPAGRVQIPGYEILGELGRGAMGVVYKARQVKLDRVVALKMILAGGHASADDLARFQREAEAVARLQHPNIVQIFEIGEQDGRPFVALEFVDGGTLQKQVNGRPQPPRAAARLVETLARAVQFAHERGIVHRDLKPGNILLSRIEDRGSRIEEEKNRSSGDPRSSILDLRSSMPKITDFGLAKRLDDESGQTASGDILGTPSYMAPEQAAGKAAAVGPAADVYALGAILYDLLAGRPPLRGESVLDTLQMVRSLDPVPPRHLQPKVPRDLETICLKCLRKESRQRYAGAGALADDLRRFLANEPIAAKAVGPLERGLKWCRRRPTAAALLGLCVLVVVALAGCGWAFARYEAWRADEANRLRHAADREREHAEHNFREALLAVEEMLTRVGQERLAYQPRMEQVRRDLLLKALTFYERFLGERGDDPAVRRETARARQRVGDIQELLGNPAAAEEAYRKAESLFVQLAADDPETMDYQRDLATCRNNFGNLLSHQGRLAEAQQVYGQALELRKDLADRGPDNAGYRYDCAVSYHNQAVLLQARSQFPEAEQHYRQALAYLAPIAGDTEEPSYLLERCRCLNNLGGLLAALVRRDEAETAHGAARDGFERLTRKWPGNADYRQELASSYNHLGNLWRDTRPVKAERSYRDALALRAGLAAEYPTIPAYRQELANTYNNLAICLQAGGKAAAADEAFRQALAVKEKLADDFPRVPEFRRECGSSYTNWAILLQQHNRLAEAESAYRRALGYQERLAREFTDQPAYQQERAATLHNLAALLVATNPAEAVKVCRQALGVRRDLAGRFPGVPSYRHDLAGDALQFGSVLQATGQGAAAETAFREAADLLSKLAGESPGVPDYRHEWAVALGSLAKVVETGHPQEAEQAWRTAVRLLGELADEVKTVPGYRQQRASCLNDLAVFLASAGRVREGEQSWKEAVAVQKGLAEQFPGEPVYREELARSHGNLGILFAALNRPGDAEEQFRSATALQEALVEKQPAVAAYWQELLGSAANLASLLTATAPAGTKAEKAWRRLVALQEQRVAALPGVDDYERDLGQGLLALGEFLHKNDRPAAAEEAFTQAVRRLRALRGRSPGYAPCRPVLAGAYFGLAEAQVRQDRHAAAVAAVTAALEAGTPKGPAGRPDLLRAAGLLARCAGLAGKDRTLSETDRQQAAEKDGDEALKLLRQVVADGYRDADALKEGAAFEPLKSRPDFQKLLEEMTHRAPAGGKGD